MVDLGTEKHGSTVELNKADRHLHSVVTVFDSPYDDVIIGNALGNFLSCSGGTDFLKGGGGSDKYIIKAGCRGADISNLAEDKISDVLFIQHAWGTIKTEHRFPHLVLKVADTDIEVKLLHWFEGENFHHLAVQTIDGIIATLPLNASDPEVMIPMEINLSKEECTDQKQMFDLSKDPWRKVQRFQAKSNKCSYTVIGNKLDNFIDPGTGNINNYQYLRGGNGSDTYVLGHAYGYENEIDNKAEDMKPDNLFLQVLYEDIEVLLERPHIIMFSRSRNDSVRVRLLKYLQGPEFQHLLVRSLDGFLFEIDGDSYPYKSVLSIDMTSSSKSCNISCVSSKSEYSNVSKIHGSTAFSNYITGSNFSSLITGGNMADYILGNQGSEKIEGFGGNDVIIGEGGDDVLEGGEGEDKIRGGEGDDFIYGGGGADRIDGGPGVDTVFFSGDVRTGSGVTVDLVIGRGGGADAENDTFTGVERVIGTEFNDLLIGDNEDNQLIGKFGNDTLVPGHGSDLLCGGPGRDFYILEDSSGVKHINNFAADRIEDYILIRNFTPKDACFFTQEGNLVISLHYQDRDPLLNLMGRDTLTIILDNWSSNHSLYQHISFVFENDTYIDPSYFNSATEISPSLKDFNSSSISLRLTRANETAVEVEGMVLGRAGSETESMFQYWLKVSDQLFLSDSLPWGNSTSLEITGLLSGVLYTFQLYLMKCEVPVLVLQEVAQRTRPNPPLSLNVLHVTHSRVMINWTAPTRDFDPNSERYAYVVRVKEQSSTQVAHFNTSNPRVEIHDLKPKSVYMVSVSSVMEEMESREAFFPPIETSNLCQEFITPRGSTVVEEKMTVDGPVAVIKCLKGYRLISVSEIPCTPGLFLSHGPCVPRNCKHKGSIVSHGGSVNVPCLGFHFESHCNFSTLQPSPPRCCSSLSEIATGQLHSSRDSNSITIIYSCNPGYDLSGAFRFTCQVESGEWSPSPTLVMPHCEPIPCPDPPRDPHGQFHSPSDRTGSFKEGDTLSLRCDYLYHSSTEESSITCRGGHWGLVPSCEPSIRLVNVQDGLYDLVGNLQAWRSGSWTFMIHFRDIDNFSRHSCNVRQLEFVKVTRMSFSIQVECRKVKLQTAGSEYTGIVEGNVFGEGWRKICIQDSTAAKALCGTLFPDQGE
ncbi:hypothetical protein AOXY_G36562 [Acipenser oxyrinchus oxyrinchus]|uniref:Uncharacterized protein n=1 Tax=Acipenser oxyrinchus oxyrinchus TaxID=40147 RepID=A0AAD8FQ08_ACIOX|nr:hypothetical protein AOXY_G36562 [Acipenser oxyrinchus oxyrinchus]